MRVGAGRVETGFFIAIVGPSGVGKDTIIAGLREALPVNGFEFPRRVITRAPDHHEQSGYLDDESFRQAALRGEFLITWEANGLSYGLPYTIEDTIRAGRHVIVNVSRRAVGVLRTIVPRLLVVHVVAREDVIAERLRGRDRETREVQLQRLSRGIALDSDFEADIRIENNGPPEQAIQALVTVLARLPVQNGVTG